MKKIIEESIRNVLFDMAWKDKWDEVVNIYKWTPLAHKAKSSSSGDTAVHIAVSQQGKEEIAKQLIAEIRSHEGGKVALEIKNNEGDTPLHVALSKGNVRLCECIAQAYPSLVGVGNVNRETPIFLAALHGQKEAFLKLLQAVKGDTPGEH
jgi:ankyrin repeat protein